MKRVGISSEWPVSRRSRSVSVVSGQKVEKTKKVCISSEWPVSREDEKGRH